MKIFDLHTHSTYSDGPTGVDYIVKKAKEKGYKAGISDHLFSNGLNTLADIERYLNDLREYDVYIGGEANIGEEFIMPDKVRNKFDYLIASVHSVPDGYGGRIPLSRYFSYRGGFRDRWENQYDHSDPMKYLYWALNDVENFFREHKPDIYGHPTVLPFYEDMLNDSQEIIDWEKSIVSLCRKYNVALELSGLWRAPNERVVQLAIQEGVKISLGSDCHRVDGVCDLDYPLMIVDKLEITEDMMFIPQYRGMRGE
ncbi:MAG TPA: hypothetical protein GXX20_09720 [Clostridiaceae bacterium]|nr:hypothetical protein [Clostridiaceae bacterium]